MARRTASRWWAKVGDALLVLVAALGTLCIVLVIAAAAFDVRIVLFRTGSMSPTIPAGSAALVLGIPASEIAVGDVVMVHRPGQLPITHRVRTIQAIPDAAADVRRITMRGDANAVDDPSPYDLTHARRVLFSVPGVAPAFAALGSPWVLATVTLGMTALVVAVFWPRRPRAESPARPRTGLAVVPCVLLLLTAVLVAAPGDAHAASNERVIQGSVIRLVSIEEAAMQHMTPGSQAIWQVGVIADAPTPGAIDITLTGTETGGLDLAYDVRACEQRWVGEICASSSRTLVATSPVPTDGVERPLMRMADDDQAWLLIVVTMPASASPDIAGAVDLRVLASGYGEEVVAAPGDALAGTGGTSAWALAAMAMLLVAAGIGVALHARTTP